MILEHIREKTGEEWNQLRLRSAVLNKSDATVRLTFSHPTLLTEEQKEELTRLAKECLPQSFAVKAEFVKDYMDEDLLLSAVMQKMKEDFFSYSMRLSPEDVSVSRKEDGTFLVKFSVDRALGELMQQAELSQKLQEYFLRITTYPTEVTCDIVREPQGVAETLQSIEAKGERILSRERSKPQRRIELEGVSELVGKKITERPKYILDIHDEEDFCVVCGQIGNQNDRVTKSGYQLFSFTVTDFTGSIKVVMFPKPDAFQKLRTLVPGDTVVLQGKVTLNDYSKELEFRAFQVGRCKLKDESLLHRQLHPVPQEYSVVQPMPYVHRAQKMLFEEAFVCPEPLRGKDFVVFDFETTGLNYLEHSPIELGAVKMHDGELTEIFSTFIYPNDHLKTRDLPKEKRGQLLSDKIRELTGITDEMLEDAPAFQDIVADFYKFCYGTILVGHNVNFDFQFLNYNTKNSGYLFDMPLVDTMDVAKKYFAQPEFRDSQPAGYSLRAVSAALGIENEGAHRAYFDAITTAKCFLKMQKNSQIVLF